MSVSDVGFKEKNYTFVRVRPGRPVVPFEIHSKLRRPGFNATQTFGLIGLLWGQARRRARSWPFDSGKSAFCTIFRAEHAPLPRICYYKGKSLGSDNPGRLNVELHYSNP